MNFWFIAIRQQLINHLVIPKFTQLDRNLLNIKFYEIGCEQASEQILTGALTFSFTQVDCNL